MALKTRGPSIINIYHSHFLPSIILPTGMKFCCPLKEMTCCLFIETRAPRRGTIPPPSTLAMTSDPRCRCCSSRHTLHGPNEDSQERTERKSSLVLSSLQARVLIRRREPAAAAAAAAGAKGSCSASLRSYVGPGSDRHITLSRQGWRAERSGSGLLR